MEEYAVDAPCYKKNNYIKQKRNHYMQPEPKPLTAEISENRIFTTMKMIFRMHSGVNELSV